MNRLTRYFRLSLTSECNLSCYFCHNEGQQRLFRNRDWLSSNDFIWVCSVARDCGFRKFKLTGGEPTLRRDLLQIISGIRGAGIDDLSMITNGVRLKAMAHALRDAGLPRLNVSLFTLDPARFKPDNGGSFSTLQRIIEGIDTAISAGFEDLKLNYVWHHRDGLGDFLNVARFASERGLTVVVIPLLDEYGRRELDERASLQEIYEILDHIGIHAERIVMDGESIRRRLIHLTLGATILLRMEELAEIRPYTECASCLKRAECREGIFPIRLAANGVLRPCLAEGRIPVDLYVAIKARDTEAVRRALAMVLVGETHAQVNGGLVRA